MIAEELFDESARRNMIQWSKEDFKKTHPRLYDSIIESIDKALKLGRKPRKEDYGWVDQFSLHDEQPGWVLEGGEEAYFKALDKWKSDNSWNF